MTSKLEPVCMKMDAGNAKGVLARIVFWLLALVFSFRSKITDTSFGCLSAQMVEAYSIVDIGIQMLILRLC